VNGGEVGDEGEESLEDLELYVDTLRHAVIHCLGDRREGDRDGAQGDEALEGAEGKVDDFSIFRCTAREDGVKEIVCMPVICRDKVSG
jgi:hypothetical protein